MMHPCSECGAEYTSALAAGECEESDRLEDLNTRGWSKRYDFHRKD